MSNYGARAGAVKTTYRATKMERMINKSGIFKVIRDEGAGFHSAPKWRKRYRIIGADIYLYLMRDETYFIQKGKGGPAAQSKDLQALGEKTLTFFEELKALKEEIHKIDV